jgi:hypothetical protein
MNQFHIGDRVEGNMPMWGKVTGTVIRRIPGEPEVMLVRGDLDNSPYLIPAANCSLLESRQPQSSNPGSAPNIH